MDKGIEPRLFNVYGYLVLYYTSPYITLANAFPQLGYMFGSKVGIHTLSPTP